MRSIAPTMAALAVLALAGCQAYHARPLTAEAVDRALSPPPADSLRVQAAALRHPILPPVALDLSDGLSPDEAAVLAVLVNPSLRAVRDQRALADAQLLQAGILPNPTLSASFDVPVAGNTAGTYNAMGAGVDWDLKALVGRRAGIQAAQVGRAAVDLDVAWQEWQTAQAARMAVYDLLSLDEQVALAEEMSKRLADNLDLVRKAVGKGLMTALDLAAAEAAANQARSSLVSLTAQARQQRLALNAALGLPADARVKLQKGAALPDRIETPTKEQILSGLDERRLDLVALRRGYESQEAALRKAVLEQFPAISIGFNGARDTSNVITAGLGVTVGLPVFDRNQGAIAQETATRQKLFDEYVNRVFEARAEIARLLDNLQGIEEQLQVAQQAEPGLQRLVDTYRQAVAQGQADVLSYYTAWNDLTAKRLGVLTLRQQLADTQTALEIAAGVYRLSALTQSAGSRLADDEVTR
jgi:cobalt-zinc-cadmium efflux system outer membrane protein